MNTLRTFAAVLLSTLILLSTSVFAANTEAPMSVQRKAEIEKIIKEYLLENPEILVEVATRYQQKQRAEQLKKAEQAIKDNAQALFSDKNDPVAGDPKANVVLVEFFDYQCGHCKHMSGVVKDVLAKNKDVKIIYKELPIFGGDSLEAAKMALASQKIGKYTDVHEAFMSAPGKLSKETIKQLLSDAGVDADQLSDSAKLEIFVKVINANKLLAQKLGIRGTPAFILASNVGKPNMQVVFIPGATSGERLQSAIDQLKSS